MIEVKCMLNRSLFQWLALSITSCLFISASAQATGLQLLDAARGQDWTTIHSLLENGDVNVNATEADGSTALTYASYRDELETVQRLLDAGADPDIANVYGITPLFLAIENRSAAMVNKLLKGGADPNSATWSGETLLMATARMGFMEAMQMHLDNGVDVNAQDPRRGQTALMWSISYGYPQAARLLIEHGADVNARTIRLKEDFTPLVLEGYMGTTIHTVPMGGYTPLLFAAKMGDIETAELLLEKGADVNSASQTDGSPLLIAASQGHEDLAVYLLEQGADPNAVDGNGMTALHYALRDGIKVLHGRHIDDKTMVCNFANENFLCKPFEVLNEEQREYMKVPNAEVYIVEPHSGNRYSYKGDKLMPGHNMHKLIGALLERGADPNAKMKQPPASLRLDVNPWFSIENATPFFLAAASQDLDAVAVLLEEGANPLVKTDLEEGLFIKQVNFPAEDNMVVGNATSLMAAVGIGRRSDMTFDEEEKALEIVRILVSLGADVNDATESGWTALHAAAFVGANKIIRYLVEEGANINALNGCKQTAMSLALANDSTGLLDRTLPRPATAELLLELGADITPPIGLVGVCIPGRGGLEADDTRFRAKVRERIDPVKLELERRRQNWPAGIDGISSLRG
jgi:ankyrin repeat protein